MIYKGKKEVYPGIGKIEYEGKKSKNPLAFRWYNPEEKVGGKKMKDHLRFAIAYWHSFCGDGSDPFGNATRILSMERCSRMMIKQSKGLMLHLNLLQKSVQDIIVFMILMLLVMDQFLRLKNVLIRSFLL